MNRKSKPQVNSEEYFRVLFDLSNDAIFLVDVASGSYLDANEAAEILTGFSVEELKGKKTSDVSPADAKKRLSEAKLLNSRLEMGEVEYIRPDGSKRLAQLTCIPVSKNRVFGVARDITEKKAADLLLKSQKNEIENQNEEYRQINEELFEANQEITKAKERADWLGRRQKILTDSLVSMNMAKSLDELYEILGKAIFSSITEAYLICVKLNPEEKSLQIASHFGTNAILKKVSKIIGLDVLQFKVHLADFSEDDLKRLQNDRLQMLDRGIQGLVGSRLSKTVCQALEKILGVKAVYAMGIYCNNLIYGGVGVLYRKSNHLFADHSFAETLVRNATIIIERKYYEQELLASERRYRLITEKITDVVWLMDTKGNSLFVSPSIEKFTGYTVDEYLKQSITDRFTPDSANIAIEAFRNEVLRYSHSEFQPADYKKILVLDYRCKDGSVKTGELLVTPYFDEKKQFVSLYGVTRDITERKLAETALREAEWKFSALFEKGPIGVAYHKMIYDEAGKAVNYLFLDANKSYLELTGVDPRGKMVTEAFPGIEKDPFDWIGTYGYVAKTGKAIRFEQFLETNGRWYDCVGYQYKPDYFVAAFFEITKRKIAERALRESEEKFKAIANYSASWEAWFSPNGKLLWMNSFSVTLTGFTPDEYMAANDYLSMVIAPEDLEMAREKFSEALNGSIGDYLEVRCLRKDGSKFWVSVSWCPILDSSGSSLGFRTSAQDISARKQVEEELFAAKEKAEESDRLKTAFLQNMSHEIRTPMNAIMGFSGLLPNNFNNKQKLKKYSEIINQRCSDLLDIINDILDIAKIESGQLPVNMEECNLNLLFNELSLFFTEHQKRIGKQKINFSLQSDCLAENFKIVTDKVKLKQIFINLISNAFKFTKEGSIEGGCKLDTNHQLVFYVSDTGVGIPPEKQHVIFDRFTQLDYGQKQALGGTGLGLSIVKGLVELLGGELWLETQPTKGTSFYFTISYKEVGIKKADFGEISENRKLFLPDKTVLVVEDDVYNAEYLMEVLSEASLKVIHTEYGQKAVEIAKDQPIDLVLMDIRLPDIDGYEATRLILEQKPSMKIIAQTAYAMYDEKIKALQAGCIDYISKPTKPDVLIAMVYKSFS